MTLSDFQLVSLLMAQYDATTGAFDEVRRTSGIDWALKSYPDCTVIAFEGGHDIPDWISNFKALMLKVPDFAGVESGFYEGLPETFIEARPLLPQNKPVYVTGHSRGAAHAQIFAGMLIKGGYNVIVVVFGCPRPGDAELAAILRPFPNRSYRNFKDFDHQDFVCDVPLDLKLLAPFVHPDGHITVNIPPIPGDPWLLFARHHIQLYAKGVSHA